MIDISKEKLKLEYPCKWTFSVIGKDELTLRKAVEKILQNQSYELNPSHSSKSGKYYSMKLQVMVLDEKDRTNLFDLLKKSPDIVMVL